MKKSLFLSMLALSALVFSCKKDDDKSPAELIVGKWNLVQWTDNDYYNNTNHRDTGNFQTGQYTREFLSNGKVIDKYSSQTDTSVYKIEGSKLIIDTYDTININSISGSDMQLYWKYSKTPTTYYEATETYKK
jgi:hypothetical protein